MDVSEKILRYLILSGFPIAVGISLTSAKIIDLLYSNSFQEAGLVLEISAWSIAAVFIQTIFAALLTAADLQKEKMVATAVNLVLASVLYIVLIQRYDSLGAAAAKGFAAVIGIVCFYYLVSKHLQRLDLFTPLIKPALACVPMALFLRFCASWNLVLLIPIAAVIYFAALLLLREIKQEDFSYIKELMMPKTFTAGN